MPSAVLVHQRVRSGLILALVSTLVWDIEMSDKHLPIEKTIELLRKIRSDLQQHPSWNEIAKDIDAAINELEAALISRAEQNSKRIASILARIAWIIEVLIGI